MLNLDTHILVKAFENDLTARERKALSADPDWSISAIVLWEMSMLAERGRIRLGLDHPLLVAALDQLHVWPITRAICLNLAELDFESDPADELIAATSLTHDLPLVTRDERIRASRKLRFA